MTCDTCRHRVETTCHRFPPQIYPNQVRVWPTIALEDRCGEYNATVRALSEREDGVMRMDTELPVYRGVLDRLRLRLRLRGIR